MIVPIKAVLSHCTQNQDTHTSPLASPLPSSIATPTLSTPAVPSCRDKQNCGDAGGGSGRGGEGSGADLSRDAPFPGHASNSRDARNSGDASSIRDSSNRGDTRSIRDSSNSGNACSIRDSSNRGDASSSDKSSSSDHSSSDISNSRNAGSSLKSSIRDSSNRGDASSSDNSNSSDNSHSRENSNSSDNSSSDSSGGDNSYSKDASSSIVLRPLRGSDAALAAVGLVSGFASGLLGIGGGTVVTPLLALLSGACTRIGEELGSRCHGEKSNQVMSCVVSVCLWTAGHWGRHCRDSPPGRAERCVRVLL